MKTGRLVFFTLIGFFLLTNVADDVGWEDSGELTTSAYLLSISHPTGFPLYLMVVKCFQLLPLGNIAYRANLCSGVAAYFSLLLLFRILVQSTGRSSIGYCGVLTLLFMPHLLLQSSVAEIYTVNLLFVALCLSLIITHSTSSPLGGSSSQRLLLVSFLIGLGGGIQPTFIFFGSVIFILFFYNQRPDERLRDIISGYWLLLAGLLFVIGFSVNLYLPIRGSQALIYHWGPLPTWSEVWDHISAVAYRTGFRDNLVFPQPLVLWQRLRSLVQTVSSSSLTILWPLIALGMFSFWKAPKLKLTLGAVLGLDLGYTLLINPMGIKALQTSLVSLFCVSLFLGLGLDILVRDTQG